jgi:hypothetical protein
MSCCAPGIVVKNDKFTGGQNAQPNSMIQQKDIDGAAQPLMAGGQAAAQADLQKQVRASERVAGQPQCNWQISSNPKAGALARQATVQVTAICIALVYDNAAARQKLTGSLQRKELTDPTLGAAYTLDGQVALTQVSATYDPNGDGTFSVSVQFHAQGLWVYQFTSAVLRSLAAQIAGKSQADARALLLRQPGILGVQFSASSGLPASASAIQISVQQPVPVQGS